MSSLGAKLGAIRNGLLRSWMDGDGHGGLWLRDVWRASDSHGLRLDIYGSGGWGFESSGRAAEPLRERGFLRFGLIDRLTLGSHLACPSTPTRSVEHVALAGNVCTTTRSYEGLCSDRREPRKLSLGQLACAEMHSGAETTRAM
jgi:hypothetical protein